MLDPSESYPTYGRWNDLRPRFALRCFRELSAALAAHTERAALRRADLDDETSARAVDQFVDSLRVFGRPDFAVEMEDLYFAALVDELAEEVSKDGG